MIARIVLFAVAALLLGAHFLRQGNIAFMALCLLTPLLFLIRKRWSLIVLQAAAYLATAIWIGTAVGIAQERLAIGRSYMAAVVILGSVAAVTLIAGLLLNSRAAKEKYPASSR
jgi:hypothetical protein